MAVLLGQPFEYYIITSEMQGIEGMSVHGVQQCSARFSLESTLPLLGINVQECH